MKFNFPDVGEGINQAEVIEWLIKEGDTVTEDQNIVKVETDKAIVDLPSPANGTITKIYKQKGEIVKVGETLVEINDGKETTEKPIEKKEEAPKTKNTETPQKPEEKTTQKKSQESQTQQLNESQGVVGTIEVGTGTLPPQTEKETTTQTQATKILPSLRKKAEEKGIIIETIKGSGKDGRIKEEDLEGKIQQKKQETIKITKKYDLFGYIEHVELKGLRKKIAENMELQGRIPTVIHMDEAYIDLLVKTREEGKKKIIDTKLTYLPFIIKATIAALKEHPKVNAVYTPEEIILKKYYNIGIAVATEDGLLVPVIKGADEKNIHEIAKEIEGLAQKARDRTLDIMDMKGGTFTITNVGSIGGIFATPIINPGEGAILATGALYDKVVSIKGKTKIVKALPLSLAFDHRLIDGADGAYFMNTLKKYLENPNLLLFE